MGLFSLEAWLSWSNSWREVLVACCVFAQILVLMQVFKASGPATLVSNQDQNVDLLDQSLVNPGVFDDDQFSSIRQRLLESKAQLKSLSDPYLSRYIAEASSRLNALQATRARKSLRGHVLTRGIPGVEDAPVSSGIGRDGLQEAALMRLRGAEHNDEEGDSAESSDGAASIRHVSAQEGDGGMEEDEAVREIIQPQLSKSLRMTRAMDLRSEMSTTTSQGSESDTTEAKAEEASEGEAKAATAEEEGVVKKGESEGEGSRKEEDDDEEDVKVEEGPGSAQGDKAVAEEVREEEEKKESSASQGKGSSDVPAKEQEDGPKGSDNEGGKTEKEEVEVVESQSVKEGTEVKEGSGKAAERSEEEASVKGSDAVEGEKSAEEAKAEGGNNDAGAEKGKKEGEGEEEAQKPEGDKGSAEVEQKEEAPAEEVKVEDKEEAKSEEVTVGTQPESGSSNQKEESKEETKTDGKPEELRTGDSVPESKEETKPEEQKAEDRKEEAVDTPKEESKSEDKHDEASKETAKTESAAQEGKQEEAKAESAEDNSKAIALPGTPSASSDSCDGKRVFVYDYLPGKFNRDLITDCHNPCDNFCDDMCPTLQRDGLGGDLDRPENDTVFIDSYDGSSYEFGPWLGTQQNLVGVVFRARMQTYPCQTTDWEKADAFYIPALFGLKTLYGSHLPFREIEEMGDELEEFLAYQPGFQRKGGKDHFFVVGQQYNDFMCRERNDPNKDWSWCSYLFYRPKLSNITLVSVERPWWDQRIQSVPYLTAFHPSTEAELKEWVEHVKQHPRPHRLTLLAGRRSSVPVRQAVLAACEANSDKCRFVDCSGECPRGSCRKVVGVCGEPRLVAKEYLSSTFCLMPNGDSATRRSIFDSLIAGCIPVHFDPDSFDRQYPWHKNSLHPHDVSVLFDREKTENGTLDFITELMNIPEEKLNDMRQKVFDLIPSLVFRDHTKGDLGYTKKDAFDFSVEGILQHLVSPVTYSS